MNLHRLLDARRAAGKPVQVALIGAGKFGSMFLSQVPHTPGLEVPVIVDLDPDRAREACRTVGWDAARIAATTFTADAAKATSGNIEVIDAQSSLVHARDADIDARFAAAAARVALARAVGVARTLH